MNAKKIVMVICFLAAVTGTAMATDVVVLKGGSLWDVTVGAGRNGADWPQLYAANPRLPAPVRRGGIVDVRVYPGQRFTLPASWSAGTINPVILRVIVPTPAPTPASQPGWWQQSWGWLQDHPWILGLLGFFGLLGLFGLRRRRPEQPAPQPQPCPARTEVVVNVTVHCCPGQQQGGSPLIAVPRTEVTLGEGCQWRTEVRHNLR